MNTMTGANAATLKAEKLKGISLAVDARFVWGLVPRQSKRALIVLQESGRLTEARAVILEQAEATLGRFSSYSSLDCCWALEAAAARWLMEHGNSQAPITNSQPLEAAA